MQKWNVRKCKMEILEKTEAAPCLPTCRKILQTHFQESHLEDSLLPGLPRSQGVCCLGATEVHHLLAPLQLLTESPSASWGSWSGKHGDHRKVRRQPSALPGVLLLPLVAPKNHQVCSGYFSQLSDCMTPSGPKCLVPRVIQKGMGWIQTCWNTLQLTPRTYC